MGSEFGVYSVSDFYNSKVEHGEIEGDPQQRALAERFDRLQERVSQKRLSRKTSSLGWLFAKRQPPEIVKGLYVWGAVGRGKTMVMDLFFEIAPVKRKGRFHFHEFMRDMHARIKVARADIKAGVIKGEDPIRPVADDLADELKLLCFDEFSVTDIADAMLLGRLFTRLFERGVVVVATSNVEPSQLYKDGLNRQLFLPFIELLKQQCEIVCLDARTDFRMEKLSGEEVFLYPDDDSAKCRFQAMWESLIEAPRAASDSVAHQGRSIHVPEAWHGMARFHFGDLCANPLGASDYLRLCSLYHTVFIEGIPLLGRFNRNEAKRFIILIDTLYDNHIRLIATAAASPLDLYTDDNGTEAFEFHRTASRLVEMQSRDYLSQDDAVSLR
ncbi:cell division protein ZapE [Cohaesibacter sp. ES.047]|uniref:cell division protein ZapE n=1 Tax=Cohaesibacter sp. ES.047 TaxID=1798205 RepID=UPI000BB6A07D|nr:cell division protein ZapE [Cohaesibacter sp. ES.047]SNY90660.1 cell division protein ZapE [Cohaesibacter sp. ES.047]